MATTESENFYRLVSLLVDVGTEVIRRLFLKYAVTPPTITSVTQFLVQENSIIARLADKRILGPAQMTLLQPSPGQIVDPQLWDISLLCVLLKNLCPITQVERKEIDTVRTTRNEMYGHRAAATVSDVDFMKHWGAVEASVKTIARCCNDVDFENHVAKYIDSVKNGPLDLESVLQVFKEWSKNAGNIQTKLDTVSVAIDDVSATLKDLASRPKVADQMFENLKEQTRILLEYKCKQPFIPTKQFGEALSILNQEGSVIISGKPGEGKTLTAYKLVENVGLSDRCIRLYNPSHWDHVDTDEVDIILLDDVFGKHQLDTGTLNSWIPVLQSLEACLNTGQLKIILTSRQNVLLEAKNKLDTLTVIKKNVIELTSSALTGVEKQGILSVLLDFHGRDKSKVSVKSCCNVYKANIGFPYCAFLFAADKSLFDLHEKFFERPIQFFKEALEALSKEIKASLLFLFYKQGQCIEKDLKPSIKKKSSEDEEILLRITDLIGIGDKEMSLAQVRDILEEFSGIYITHLSKTFTFAHNIVYECIALMHSERYPEEVIEHCTWNFIKGCVDTVPIEGEAKLVIDKDLYENLCSRFIKETVSEKPVYDKFYDVSTHRTMQTRNICVTLYKLLQEEGKMRRFLTSLMHDNQQGFLSRYLNIKNKTERPYLVEEAVLYLNCICHADEFRSCWKCHVRNDAARAACINGDIVSYSLMLEEGITIKSDSIRDACTGENPKLLKHVISTVKNHGKFIPDEVCISKSLVIAKHSNLPEMYEVLQAEGAVVMPLCVYDAVVLKKLSVVKHFVKELKQNGRWDPADFWLQKALQESISIENPDICNLLKEEGLGYHRGCLLAAVQSKQLSKVKQAIAGMKVQGTWQSSDWTIPDDLKTMSKMFQSGALQPLNIPSLADRGVSEALIEAKYYEDKSIYEYLLTEGVQLTMESLPVVVNTRQLDLIKEVIKELKDQDKWDLSNTACAKAMFEAIHHDLANIYDLLVSEGITCTMEILPLIMTEKNITVQDVKDLATLIKQFGNWQPNCISMQTALIEAFQRDDKSIFDYLMQNGASINSVSVLTAVFSQDINTVSMCLQILKASPSWDPSDPVLNMCMEMIGTTAPEIYALMQDAGVGYSSKSLLSAAARNDSIVLMMAINELIGSDKWRPETDSNVTQSLDLVCQHNNMMMFNVLQKKGAKLSQLGIFNIIQNSKSLWYDIGPENRKQIQGVPSLSAIITASLVKKFLVPAFQQKAITVYVRLIHALEETGKLDSDDPLLHDALVAAVESGDVLAYDIATETGTKVTVQVVLRLLLSIKDGFRIEFPERLTNRTYRTCVMQCLLESIRKGNTDVLENTTLLMKQNTLWCPDDQRIIQAISDDKSAEKEEIVQKLFALKLISKPVMEM